MLKQNMNNPIRLQKVLADLGYGSRRKIDAAIAAGQVKVNRQIAVLGQKVTERDAIVLFGKPIERLEIDRPDANRPKARPPRLLIYNKPIGEICTRSDPENRPTIFERLPVLKRSRWISVGRLDINSSGLLLLTNQGDLANRLMHPSYNIEREYLVRVLGEVTPKIMKALTQGVMLEDGSAALTSVKPANRKTQGANYWYRAVITEGRQREVRRLFESKGLVVTRLIRIRYGIFTLPRDLKKGAYDELPRCDFEHL